MNDKDINEDIELGPETMTVEDDIQNIEESVDDVKDEHIGEKTCLVLETPGGISDITLNGDYETNVFIIDLIREALEMHESRYGNRNVSFYSKACNSLHEAEFLGKENKFAPNTVGAIVSLLQKSGDMNDILITKCVPSNVPLMPVNIASQNGVVALDFAEGTPSI